MRKAKKTLRALGYTAPVALTLALVAPIAMGHQSSNVSLWSAKEANTAWTTTDGKCWQSKTGPTNLAPCVKASPKEVTVRLMFDVDKFMVPDNVFNQGEVAKIDQYIKQLKATPEKELITVVGHTDASGSDEHNFDLGLKRAKAVRDYIISRGYPADNVAAPESRGESELLPGFDPLSVEQRRVTLTNTELLPGPSSFQGFR